MDAPVNANGTIGNPRKRKRTKSTVACNRCIVKKRKCDGDFASGEDCRNCRNAGEVCEYSTTRGPNYVKILEKKVNQLEEKLALYQGSTLKAPDDLEENFDSKCTHGLAQSPLFIPPLVSMDSFAGPFNFSFAAVVHGHLIYGLTNDDGDQNQDAARYIYASTDEERKRILTDLDSLLRNHTLMGEYLDNYCSGIHIRYPFLLIGHLKRLHETRLALFVNDTGANFESISLKVAMDRFILLMVYALGSRVATEAIGMSGGDHHLVLYKSALWLNLYRDIPIGDTRTIHAMILLVIFQMRFTPGVAIWHLIGSTLRLCVNLGLHTTNLKLFRENPYEYNSRCKTFWSAYCLERVICLSFSKPHSLGDRDINVHFPIDIDENITDPAALKTKFYQIYPHYNHEEFKVPSEANVDVRSSVSPAIIQFKYRQIESKIQSTIYRADIEFGSIPRSQIEDLRRQAFHWKNNLPNYLSPKEYNYWLYMFNKQLRFLIQPFLSALDGKDPLFLECIQACVSVCNLIKEINLKDEKITFVSLQTVFSSGLNLIYGLLSKKCKWDLDISEGLRNCKAFLDRLAQRSSGCERYSEIFQRLLDQAVDGQNIPESASKAFLDKFSAQFRGYASLEIKARPNSMPPVDILFGQNEKKVTSNTAPASLNDAEYEADPLSTEANDMTDFNQVFDLDELWQNFTNLDQIPTEWGIDF